MSESMKNEFTGLPIKELISGPLIAAAESQFALANTNLNFVKKIGFKDTSDGSLGTPNILDFKLEQPVINRNPDGTSNLTTNEIQVKAPLLGLVPIPSLLIEDVSVEFQMEVTASTNSTEKQDSSAELDISVGYWTAKAEFKGKVSSSRENTRSTNQTAKYNIRLNARQQQQTEGMSKLMDIMASCIAPIDLK